MTPRCAPDAPVIPDAASYNELGIDPGSSSTDPLCTLVVKTCNTDATSADPLAVPPVAGGQVPEDGCDEVPAKIPPINIEPGGISGLVWHDTNPDLKLDGVVTEPAEPRVAGVPVQLIRVSCLDDDPGAPAVLCTDSVAINQCGAVSKTAYCSFVASTVTGAAGTYKFNNVPPNSESTYYRVLFGITSAPAPAAGGTWALITQRSECFPEIWNPVTKSMVSGCADDSDANEVTSLTGLFQVVEGATVENVNAGLEIIQTGVLVTKTSEFGDAPRKYVGIGKSLDNTHVSFELTNTGQEALVDLKWNDETRVGPAVHSWQCTTTRSGSTVIEPVSVTDPPTPFDQCPNPSPTIGSPPPPEAPTNATRSQGGWCVVDGTTHELVPLTLEPGDAVSCNGLLDGMGWVNDLMEPTHLNLVTVNGRGLETSALVTDADSFGFEVHSNPPSFLGQKLDGWYDALDNAQFALYLDEALTKPVIGGQMTQVEGFPGRSVVEVPPGCYWIREVLPPSRYQGLPAAFEIRVDEDGMFFITGPGCLPGEVLNANPGPLVIEETGQCPAQYLCSDSAYTTQSECELNGATWDKQEFTVDVCISKPDGEDWILLIRNLWLGPVPPSMPITGEPATFTAVFGLAVLVIALGGLAYRRRSSCRA
jgi:hypothetical protein